MSEKKSNMVTRRHIIIAAVFVVSVCLPIGLIPVFPDNAFFQLLYSNSLVFLGLVFGGVILSIAVDSIFFRKENE